MDQSVIDEILWEWADSQDRTLAPELQAVSTALFLEETFGVTLRDAQIDPLHLGTVDAMKSTLARLISEA